MNPGAASTKSGHSGLRANSASSVPRDGKRRLSQRNTQVASGPEIAARNGAITKKVWRRTSMKPACSASARSRLLYRHRCVSVSRCQAGPRVIATHNAFLPETSRSELCAGFSGRRKRRVNFSNFDGRFVKITPSHSQIFQITSVR